MTRKKVGGRFSSGIFPVGSIQHPVGGDSACGFGYIVDPEYGGAPFQGCKMKNLRLGQGFLRGDAEHPVYHAFP